MTRNGIRSWGVAALAVLLLTGCGGGSVLGEAVSTAPSDMQSRGELSLLSVN